MDTAKVEFRNNDESPIRGVICSNESGSSGRTNVNGIVRLPVNPNLESIIYQCTKVGYNSISIELSGVEPNSHVTYYMEAIPGPEPIEAESIEFKAFNADDDFPLDGVEITANGEIIGKTPLFNMEQYNKSKGHAWTYWTPPVKFHNQEIVFTANRNHYATTKTDPILYDPKEGLEVVFYMEVVDYPETHGTDTDEEYNAKVALLKEFYPPGAGVELVRLKPPMTELRINTYYVPLQGLPTTPAPGTVTIPSLGIEKHTEDVKGVYVDLPQKRVSTVTVSIPRNQEVKIIGKPDDENWYEDTIIVKTNRPTFYHPIHFRNFKIGDKPDPKKKYNWIIVVLLLIMFTLIFRSLATPGSD